MSPTYSSTEWNMGDASLTGRRREMTRLCGPIVWFAEAQFPELDKTKVWPFTELAFQSESSLPAIPSSPLPKLRLGPPAQLL